MNSISKVLYVGSLDDAYNEHIISNVTHILNVADEIDINQRINHNYIKCACSDDDPNENIQRIIPECIEWIHNSIQTNGIVLVHCLEGKSRSVCVCIAYLCLKDNWDFDQAYNHIKNIRPIIDIYPLYLQQVREYVISNLHIA